MTNQETVRAEAVLMAYEELLLAPLSREQLTSVCRCIVETKRILNVLKQGGI